MPVPNRSVYVIGAPHRENFMAKEDGLVVGGAACPIPPGTPLWCHGFCQRENKQITSYSRIASRVQKHAPPRLCANATYRRTLQASWNTP